jgi:hypothetical protein
MGTPKDAYEGAIEKMAKAAWNEDVGDNVEIELWENAGPALRQCYREEARIHAEAIGLREMMEDATCWRRLWRAREDESSSSYAGLKRP